MPRAAAYCRVSTDMQKEDGTVAVQVDAIKHWLTGHPNITLVEPGWYIDEGYSGVTPLEKRPRGRDLLQDIEAHKLDILLVWKTDRIFRDDLAFRLFVRYLQDNGVTLRSVTEPYDINTDEGELVSGLYAYFARKERKTMNERTKGGKIRVAKMGKWPQGRPAYGYDITADGYLVINAEQAEVVRDIFNWYVSGVSMPEMVERLRGTPTPQIARGYRQVPHRRYVEWMETTIGDLLKRTVYYGEFHYTPKGEETIIIPTPAIVDRETWERAQVRRIENTLASHPNPEYLLSGLPVCAECGRLYTGHRGGTNGRARYYTCNGRRRRYGNSCTAPHVRAEPLERWVWEMVERFIKNPGEALERFALSQGEAKARLEALAIEIGEVDKQLARAETKRQELISLCADGVITRNDLQIQLGDIEEEKERIQAKKARFVARRDELLQGEADAQIARRTLEQMRVSVQDVTLADKRHLIKSLVKRINIGRKEDGKPAISVVFAFDMSSAEKPSSIC